MLQIPKTLHHLDAPDWCTEDPWFGVLGLRISGLKVLGSSGLGIRV